MNCAAEVKPHQAVVDCNGKHFAKVDHMEGEDIIKLTKDADDVHHYIPTNWVAAIDDRIHLTMSASEAKGLWMTDNPNQGSVAPS